MNTVGNDLETSMLLISPIQNKRLAEVQDQNFQLYDELQQHKLVISDLNAKLNQHHSLVCQLEETVQSLKKQLDDERLKAQYELSRVVHVAKEFVNESQLRRSNEFDSIIGEFGYETENFQT